MSIAAAVLVAIALPQAKISTTFATTTNNRTGYYTTSLKVPTFAGSPLAAYATRQLKLEAATGLADWMKQNFTGAAAKTKPRLEYFYQAQPFVSMATPDVISMYFMVSTFEAGAHPMSVYDPHTFAMVDGKPVEVHAKDLFNPSTKFVDLISSLVISKLMQNPRAQWVTDGTVKALTPGQVDSFVVTPSSITYLFNPYDMGPYAVGTFEVKVPFSEIATDLNKSGPLQSLLQ
jgi:hypothetical protein